MFLRESSKVGMGKRLYIRRLNPDDVNIVD